MKHKLLFIAIIAAILLNGCKQEITRYDNYIGRWEMRALYLNGGSVNMLPTAELFEPCFKGSTLEFTERNTFELITDCDWMADKGNYSVDETGKRIEAVGEQGTQYFDFVDGQLKMIIKNGDYTFDLRFEKQEYKSEYVIKVNLKDVEDKPLIAPEDYSLVYYVNHGDSIRIEAPEVEGYAIEGESVFVLKDVNADQELTFVYRNAVVKQYKITLELLDELERIMNVDESIQKEYWVNEGDPFTLAAPEIESYSLISDNSPFVIASVDRDSIIAFIYQINCESNTPLVGTWHIARIMSGTSDMTTMITMVYPCILNSTMVFDNSNNYNLNSTCDEITSLEALYCRNGNTVKIYNATSEQDMTLNGNNELEMPYSYQGTILTLIFTKQ